MTIIDQDGRFLPAQQTGEIGGLGRPGCVHELFEAQVAREPNTVALRQGTRQLSYGELNAKANQLAHRLQALGVKPDDRVAILMERSVEMVVGLLAALKAGGACVPLDPADPVQRPSDILEDGAPKVILTQGSVWHRLQEHRGSQPMGVGTAPVLDLEDPTPPWAVKHTGNPQAREAGLTPQHLAYVIYPSGSTGEPKGVVMEHGQLTDLVESRRRTFGTSQACGSNGPAGVTIDAWTWELWSALSDGASLLIAASNELKPIEPVSREQPLPLSFAQQRMWFLAQIEEVSQAYHIPMGFRLLGPLDRAAMQRALGRIVERHEALRTTFLVVNGEPTQHITRPDIDFELQHHDLREHTDATRELQRLSEQEAGARFDLQEGPLIRGRLIQLTASEHVLLLTMHHIVSDRWSMAVLTDELGALYGAFSQGRSDPLPALRIQYPDFAAWQRRWLSGVVQQSQSEYWQHTLQGAPELIELPTDRPRPQRQDHAGGAVEFAFDERLSAGLKALGQRHGMTRFMTLLAVWGAVLVRLSGQDEVVIGTPVANRKRSELEQLIGFFVNTLALRLDSSGSPSVAQWLERVKAQALGAQQHQDLPFEQVVELMHPVRSLAHSPLVQVMFTWEQDSAPDLPGLRTEAVQLGQTIAQFDLTLTLRERGGRIAGNLGYASALFDSGTIERHIEYLRCIASAMVAD